jgi:hypothetical protein
MLTIYRSIFFLYYDVEYNDNSVAVQITAIINIV